MIDAYDDSIMPVNEPTKQTVLVYLYYHCSKDFHTGWNPGPVFFKRRNPQPACFEPRIPPREND